MVKFYALMCVLGTVMPYSALVGWSVKDSGWDVAAMLAEIAGSRMSLFAWADVLVSAVVLIAFIRHEGRRASVPGLWLPIAGTCAVGVSLGLPLFLLMRERELLRDVQPLSGRAAAGGEAGDPRNRRTIGRRGLPRCRKHLLAQSGGWGAPSRWPRLAHRRRPPRAASAGHSVAGRDSLSSCWACTHRAFTTVERRIGVHDGSHGGQGQNRTADTRIFSPLLYRLSYLAKRLPYGGGRLLKRPAEIGSRGAVIVVEWPSQSRPQPVG